MTVNFLKQLELVGVPRNRVLVYGWDNTTCEAVDQEWDTGNCYSMDWSVQREEIRDHGGGSVGFSHQVETWGTSRYMDMINSRLRVVRYILDYHWDIIDRLWVMDTDAAVFRDPLRWWSRFGNVSLDAWFQEEFPGKSSTQRQINGGCYLLRSSSKSLQLINRSIDMMHRLKLPDQDAVQLILERYPEAIEWDFLPTPLFPNGFYWFYRGTEPSVTSPVYVHANWITGYRGKVQRLRTMGRWFMDNEEEEQHTQCSISLVRSSMDNPLELARSWSVATSSLFDDRDRLCAPTFYECRPGVLCTTDTLLAPRISEYAMDFPASSKKAVVKLRIPDGGDVDYDNLSIYSDVVRNDIQRAWIHLRDQHDYYCVRLGSELDNWDRVPRKFNRPVYLVWGDGAPFPNRHTKLHAQRHFAKTPTIVFAWNTLWFGMQALGPDHALPHLVIDHVCRSSANQVISYSV